MKYLMIILSFIAIVLITPSSSYAKTVKGSGNIIKDSRSVAGFDKVSISGSGFLLITQGDEESLAIECDDNIASYIRSSVKDGTLNIG